MAGDDFFERMALAKQLVGGPSIEGVVNVDQVYAHYQDSGVGPRGKPAEAFDHPRGGEAGYLSKTLTEKGPEYAQRLAEALGEEVPMVDRMAELAGDLADEVFSKAPREFWLLRNSAGAWVDENGTRHWYRPPLMPRASQEELDAIRAMAGGDRQHGSGEVQHLSEYDSGRLSHKLGGGA